MVVAGGDGGRDKEGWGWGKGTHAYVLSWITARIYYAVHGTLGLHPSQISSPLLLYALCHPSTCLSLSKIIFRYIQPLCEVPLGLTYTLLDHLRERNVIAKCVWQPGWGRGLGER